MKISVDATSETRSGCAGRGFVTIFFGFFLLIGSLFVVVILGEALQQLAPWWWRRTECTVLSSAVAETGDDRHPYRTAVRFSYELDGRRYESDRFSRGDDATASFDRARDRAGRYPPGAAGTCRVSPSQPSRAVLEPRVPWMVFVVPFPLLFVAIGAIGLWATWRGGASKKEQPVESISQLAAPGRGGRFMIGFGLLFVVIGAAVFVPLALAPGVRLAASTTWEATPCTVVISRLRSWVTDDGTSYRADVLYEYSAEGRSWRSNRVDFFALLSSGRDDAKAILARYPSDSSASCWVNPKNPARSVLERRLRPRHLLGLIPLVFVVAGAAVANHGRKLMRSAPVADGVVVDTIAGGDGPLTLTPQLGPLAKVGGSLFFALFWNGIVSLFVWQVWQSWQHGDPNWFLTVFLIPFVLVGLVSFGFVGHFLLALANPRPRLTVTPGRPHLGDSLRLEWRFTGRAGRLQRLRIVLEGREEATYRRGTDTVTDREVFTTVDLVATGNQWEIPRGSADLVVPSESMHSFDGGSNKIVWEIKVEGEIARWPDVDQNFPITVRPMRIEEI